MRRSLPVLLALAALGLLAVPGAHAQSDVAGSRDHPLLGRFAGSVIALYEAKDFDEYTVPLGRLGDEGSALRWTRHQRVEGKVTRLTYLAPANTATLAIQRAYEAALRQAGFRVLFTGAEKDLGILYPDWYEKANPYPESRRRYLLGNGGQRLLAARLSRPEGDVWVTIYAATGNVIASARPTVQVDLVEVKALDKGLVTADAMAEGLRRSGRVAVYTLYFDTDKADLNPESEPTLKEIAALLAKQPRLGLYVVGHTDNTGALAHNVDLSQRRAAAVTQALVGRHGIDAGRLKAAGVGPLAPVAPNASDETRAKNRRVELVAQ